MTLLDYLGSDECHKELEKLVLDIQETTYGATALLLVAFGVGMFTAIKKEAHGEAKPAITIAPEGKEPV